MGNWLTFPLKQTSTDVTSENLYVSATNRSDQQKYKPADARSKNTSIGANSENHLLNVADSTTSEIQSSSAVRETANCNNTSSTALNQDNQGEAVTNTWNTSSSITLTDNSADKNNSTECGSKRCDEIGLNKACSLSDLRFDSDDHDHDTPKENNMENIVGGNQANISVEVTEECICETQNQSNLEQVYSVLNCEQQDRTEMNDHISTGHYNRDSKLFCILTENGDAYDPQTQHVVEESISKSWSQKQSPYEDSTCSVEIKHRGSFMHCSKEHQPWTSGHEDSSRVILNVRRFSEVEEISMSFPQSLTIGDLRNNIQLHYNVTDNTEIQLYQNFRQLQDSRTAAKEIEVTDEPANIMVCVSSKERRLPDGLVTDKPDMINPWDDDDRYLMSCGHAATPDNLHAYCWSELKSTKAELRCPSITNRGTEKCRAIWMFSDIINGACLSVDEMNLFSSYLNKNWLDSATRIQLCPSCGEAIEKSSCNTDLMECLYCKRSGEKMWRFCFKCLQQWLNSYSGTKCGNHGCETNAERMRDILQTCSRKTIIGVAGCPCIRACPKCEYVLEHTSVSNDSCKHMVCAACDTKFCFICLKVKTDTLYWPCGGAYEQCNVAPVQLL